MGLALCLAGFFATARLAQRSLGQALGLLLAIGSAYGIVRANVYDGFVHFFFDASVLGFYLGYGRRLFEDPGGGLSRVRLWVLGLCALPFATHPAEPVHRIAACVDPADWIASLDVLRAAGPGRRQAREAGLGNSRLLGRGCCTCHRPLCTR